VKKCTIGNNKIIFTQPERSFVILLLMVKGESLVAFGKELLLIFNA
jgi:hypothetical protein